MGAPRCRTLFFLLLSLTVLFLLILGWQQISFRLVRSAEKGNTYLSHWQDDVNNQTDVDVFHLIKAPTPATAWFDTQEDRKRTLERVCRENPISLQNNLTDIIFNKRKLLWPYIVDDKYGLIYGFVSKVGSTNWKSAFLVLKGKYKSVEDVPDSKAHDPSLRKLSSYSPEDIENRLKHYTKFIFVRDPLARVLSAYRNKFQEPNLLFRINFGRKIIKLYRKNPTFKEQLTGAGVTFAEFVRFVTDEEMEGKNMDEHWIPIHQMLLPCAVPFDFIGKLETGEEDAAQILKYAKVDHLIHFKETKRNTSHSQDVFDDFYDAIPHEYITKLYRLYLLDFQLFGYTMRTNLKERKEVLVN